MPVLRGAAAGALVALCVLASPALAHEGNPNYSSEVRSIEPAVEGLKAQILNNDDRIELRNDTGGTVVVAGYRDEPYLRFLPDGTVELNRRSPAAYLNEDRFADVDVPATADPGRSRSGRRWPRTAATSGTTTASTGCRRPRQRPYARTSRVA